MDRSALAEAFDAWVRDVEKVDTPQWLDPKVPGQWVNQASDAELEAMAEHATASGRGRPKGGLLVLVAGTTPQPCLLSAFWRRPDRLIVAASDDDDGSAAADRLEGELRRRFPGGVLQRAEFPPTDPVAIVEQLTRRLDDHYVKFPADRAQTALDITGGKKTMVAAAFFLAALRRDIELSYVDGDYEPKVRLPRPCTARVEGLDNPGIALGLFAREEARTLWEEGSYRAAAQRLDAAAVRLGEENVALHRRLAQAIVAWEDLNYDGAMDLAGDRLPEAVRHLGRKWRSIRSDAAEPRDWHRALRADPWHVLLHVVDVLHWARRRGDAREQRSLFLTLYALGELVFGAVLRHDKSVGSMVSEPHAADFDDLWEDLKRGAAAKLLANGKSTNKFNKRKLSVDRLSQASPWIAERWKDLRDNAAHGLAVIDARDVTSVNDALDDLVRAAAARIGTAPDPNADSVSLPDAVTTWLAPDCPWFTVPAWNAHG